MCQRLTTFCPDGYRVFLAGVNMQEEFYHPHPGQVVTAAFVLCSPPASIADEDDGEDDDFDQSPDTSSSDPHDPPYAIDGGSSSASSEADPHARSRSPRGRREPDAVDSSGYVAAFFASASCAFCDKWHHAWTSLTVGILPSLPFRVAQGDPDTR